mmetsp:Transcript_17069/g.25723  ORF Transcript_17069/g.25723 Transcript_17069/m.25723 type:complete len:135 (-) Transcript_17069:29-433(-)|eukprot:scaffold9868_cov116-Skeletonema_dohrnii-CCMP3373.AAC.2
MRQSSMKTTPTRTVKFSSSPTTTAHYERIERKSLVWYNSVELRQFRADRRIDASRIMNMEYSEDGEPICSWGLERILLSEVRREARETRERVKKAVLQNENDACAETISRNSRALSECAAKHAQRMGTYYSTNL